MEKLTAIYEHTEDGWWVVSVPEIPGGWSALALPSAPQANLVQMAQGELIDRKQPDERLAK